MKINFQWIALAVIILWAVGATYLGYKFYKDFSRVEDNQTVLLQQVQGMKKETQLFLTPQEFKRSLDSTTKVIMKDNDITARRMENLIKTNLTGGSTVHFIPRDTIVTHNDTLIQAQVFDHNEKFLTMRGIVLKDSASVTWSTHDDISILLFWKRVGNFLPKLFGKKEYEAVVKGVNPFMKYNIDENIKIQKR